jgi:hypothetical protein
MNKSNMLAAEVLRLPRQRLAGQLRAIDFLRWFHAG